MPPGIDASHILEERLQKCELQLRKKEERVAALETENAMLYLKCAKLQGDVQRYREQNAHLVQMNSYLEKEGENVGNVIKHLAFKIKALGAELQQLRAASAALPTQLQWECAQVVRKFASRERPLQAASGTTLLELQNTIEDLKYNLCEAQEKNLQEKQKRKQLHNALVELQGNIRVHCRVRPLLPFDTGSEDISTLGRPGSVSEVIVSTTDEETLCIKRAKQTKSMEFDRVYSSEELQEAVFDEVKPLITSLLDGYNVCIMAYGQTGSGKTHTMLGNTGGDDLHGFQHLHADDGVVPRAAAEIFKLLSERPAGAHSVEVSVVEIYNNDMYDLLSSSPSTKHDLVLAAGGATCAPTVTSRLVVTVDDIVKTVKHGLVSRCESPTLVHEHSSRSHLVVTLTINTYPAETLISPVTSPESSSSESSCGLPPAPPRERHRRQLPQLRPQRSQSFHAQVAQQAETGIMKTKLQLVDLAGSECVGMSGATGSQLRETSHINKSLSSLADVLAALAENRTHVPYRNSKLTHLLQDSIGGDAKLLVLLCVSPAQRYLTETLHCLGFGQRARQVQRGPVKSQRTSSLDRRGSTSDLSPTPVKRRLPRPRSAGPLLSKHA